MRLISTEHKDFVRGPDIMVEIPREIEEPEEVPEGEEPPPPPEPEYEASPGLPFMIKGHNDSIMSPGDHAHCGSMEISLRAVRNGSKGL